MNDFRDPQFKKGCEFAKQQILNEIGDFDFALDEYAIAADRLKELEAHTHETKMTDETEEEKSHLSSFRGILIDTTGEEDSKWPEDVTERLVRIEAKLDAILDKLELMHTGKKRET